MSDSPHTFNLIDEPWLPVRRRGGGVEHIPPWRITDGLAEDPIVAFAWPRPDFNGAAHELLIGLLATTAASEDDDAWEDWWFEPPEPDILGSRFAAVSHAFDLDGPGPRFLQDADPLDDVESKDIAGLLIDTPGAQTLHNNADLFVKRGAAPVFGRRAAAMALFTLSSYAPSGGAGHRTSLRGGGPMTTLIAATHREHGDVLWGRLWPNVETRRQIDARITDSRRNDDPELIFPWLAPTRTSNPKAGGGPTTPADTHPLQVYWGMPRRIRLRFEDSQGRRCGLTAANEPVVVASYRTRNYGVNYSDGFRHPLSPYYRQNAKSAVRLPVHPTPGGISYRLWPGFVVPSKDRLREPAQVIRHWLSERGRMSGDARFAAFGYDMDNMKARAWMEGEMPLLRFDAAAREWIEEFIARATAGANTVARLLTGAVKSALVDRPRDAAGDYGFIAEQFFRETEAGFHSALGEVIPATREESETDWPLVDTLRRWAPVMAGAAVRLFDEYAPWEGLEDRDMHRHVKARFFLTLALGGRGATGKALFDGDLGIPSPETVRSRSRGKETA
ncbi:MAG: type I-E CRISPR-associated protein Cse1/CasA [Chromatiales bacterium]|nr:type I-E CRISPR-associated protein Cse1/CasA [Chromatiales bacterium]